MVKTSFPLSALPLLALADGIGLVRRRIPRFLPLLALGVALGALLYGQRLGDLAAFATLQGEVVTGYAAAMAIDGPDWDLAAFLLSALALVAAVALARRGPDRWPVALGLGIALLVLFKAGFIRHDLHAMIAWTGLALVGTVLAWTDLPRRARARRHPRGLLRRCRLRTRRHGAPEFAGRARHRPGAALRRRAGHAGCSGHRRLGRLARPRGLRGPARGREGGRLGRDRAQHAARRPAGHGGHPPVGAGPPCWPLGSTTGDVPASRNIRPIRRPWRA